MTTVTAVTSETEVTEETTVSEEPEETEETTEETEYEDDEPDYPVYSAYDYSEPVPESWQVKDSSYYDTCAFVGDSHTNGLGAYKFVDKSRIFAKDGLSIKNIRESISPYSIASVNPDNVYLMMGTNGVAWLKPEDMIEAYESFVFEVSQSLPYANIYILAIPPVTYERSSSTDEKKRIPIEKITAYNDELLKMAARNEWYFVDTYSAVCNFSGYLDSDMSSDGVHMKPDLYKAFSEYILSHTAD